MADISKINAVLLANIAEIDDVLAANIAKVNGLVFSTAFTGLLDTYTGAAAAYSTRRLYGQYTGAALRVREDSGDTETDIGFDSNGDLDTAAIASHCGSANGYVTKWYGQESSGGTGSGNDAVQTTSGSQPQIYNGTAVLTENGKPTLDFDGSNDALQAASVSIDAYSTNLLVMRTDVAGMIAEQSANAATNPGYYIYGLTGSSFQLKRAAGVNRNDISTGWTGTTQTLIELNYNGTTPTGYKDAAALTFTPLGGEGATDIGDTAVTQKLNIFSRNNSSLYHNGGLQEFIVWNADQDNAGNRAGIEGNVNAHYKIGNFGTPTSGLLYDYSGAAAAYSVRQLSNTSALAMRIREDGTDTETDIGFDANGDLDTAAISSHCGANNGYVVTWYDQSGNQVDATQATTGSQPQIYNGTAVITENGKPAIDFDGSNDGFNCSTNLRTATGASTVVQVRNVPNGSVIMNAFSFYKVQRHLIEQTGQSNYNEVAISTNETTNDYLKYVNADLGGQLLHFTTWDGSTQTGGVDEVVLYEDGAQETGTVGSIAFGTTASGTNSIGFRNDTNSQFCDGTFQEVIVYLTDQSSNRSGIETNINTYFSIY